jgi:hypothetical protein
MPYRDSVEPRRTKLRSETVDPRSEKSIMDKELPSRDSPYTEMLDPRRSKLLRESVEPMWM